MKRQHEPIKEITGTRAERVLVLSHGAAEVTAGVMPTVLGILDANGVEVLATAEEVAKHPPLASRSVVTGTELRPGGVDLVLVLGGDGSILRALSVEARTGAPVLGVNFGRVGFLASVEQADLERSLTRALQGDYITLGLPSLKAEWIGGTINAVNDLAFLRGGESRLADLSYSVDGEAVATIRCDGLICSTPVDPKAVRPGAKHALVQATVLVPPGFWDALDPDDPALQVRELAEDDTEVVVARRVPAEGRARALVDGQVASRDAVAAFIGGLVRFSGQHEQRRLVGPAAQMAILDAFADLYLRARQAERVSDTSGAAA